MSEVEATVSDVARAVRQNHTPKEHWLRWAKGPAVVQATLLGSPLLTPALAEYVARCALPAQEHRELLESAIAGCPYMPAQLLVQVYNGGRASWGALLALANNKNTPREVLVELSQLPQVPSDSNLHLRDKYDVIRPVALARLRKLTVSE